MIIVLFKGFGLGIGLIAAIGAQNAFVLSQGIKKEYNVIIPIICICCDILLISLGVGGIGSFLMSNPLLTQIASIGGAAFLLWYGLKSFIAVFKKNSLEEKGKEFTSLKGVIYFTLALTFLNPHVYIDTVILIGSISTQYQGFNRFLFGLGACIASIIWFTSLSAGGKLLSPLFKKPISWKILDSFIGCMMWFIAYGLIKTLL